METIVSAVEGLRPGDVILWQDRVTKVLSVIDGPKGIQITYYDPHEETFKESVVPKGLAAHKIEAPTTYEVLEEPLTPEQIKERMDEDGYIQGIIAVDFGEVMNTGFERCLDMISELLVGDDLLCDFHYRVIGHEGDTLHVYVCGDANMCVDDEDEDECNPSEAGGSTAAV